MPPAHAVQQCAILIGGRGTRLGQLTRNTPKPLLPCGGRPFLNWLLLSLHQQGCTEFLLLTGYLGEVVERDLPLLRQDLPHTVSITCCSEPVEAGTGGALHFARHHLAERFLLCNGDSFFDASLATMIAAASADSAEVVGRMALRHVADASRYGVVALQDERVIGFVPRPTTACSGIINTGIYLLNRRILADISPVCSLEHDVLPKVAARGQLRGTLSEGYFIDIGVPDDFQRAQTELPKIINLVRS
jgi:NDP-sugar pyrophosphorylase family protein